MSTWRSIILAFMKKNDQKIFLLTVFVNFNVFVECYD